MKCFYAVIRNENTVAQVIEWDTARAGRPSVNGTLVRCDANTVPGQVWNPATATFSTPSTEVVMSAAEVQALAKQNEARALAAIAEQAVEAALNNNLGTTTVATQTA